MDLEQTKYLRDLRTLIDQHFNLDEIQLLCFDLGVDFEHLPGDTRPLKIHSLIMYLGQRGRLEDLLNLVVAQRPNVNWPEVPPADQQVSDEQSLQLVKYSNSLLRATLDLQGRLANIVIGFFLKIYYHKSEEERDYSINSTLYYIGQYLGWVEIMRQEGQFLDLGDVSSNREVEEILRTILHAFNRDDVDDVFRLFRAEQRAIGEVMIGGAAHNPAAQRRCIGYAEFLNRLDDASFFRWFSRLTRDIGLIANEHKVHEERLVLLHNSLVDLVEFLDPNAVYASKKFRERIQL